MSVGYLASLIRAYCGDGARWDLSIEYLEESEPLGTIGCLAILDDLDDADRVLLINGDTLTDMSFSDAFAAHHDGDAITLCANRRSVRVDFGVLDRSEEHTSELQSRLHLVCRLLLEKKKPPSTDTNR